MFFKLMVQFHPVSQTPNIEQACGNFVKLAGKCTTKSSDDSPPHFFVLVQKNGVTAKRYAVGKNPHPLVEALLVTKNGAW